MWYNVFLWAMFSSIFIHSVAAVIAFLTLRKHSVGRYKSFPLSQTTIIICNILLYQVLLHRHNCYGSCYTPYDKFCYKCISFICLPKFWSGNGKMARCSLGCWANFVRGMFRISKDPCCVVVGIMYGLYHVLLLFYRYCDYCLL